MDALDQFEEAGLAYQALVDRSKKELVWPSEIAAAKQRLVLADRALRTDTARINLKSES